MTLRTFRHALTGRSIQVLPDSRAERLVEADDNWSENKPKSTSKKEANDGSGNAGGRGGNARASTDGGRGASRRRAPRKG